MFWGVSYNGLDLKPSELITKPQFEMNFMAQQLTKFLVSGHKPGKEAKN